MKKKLLFILPGPIVEIETRLYEKLSEYFSGTIIASSRRKELVDTAHVGNFAFRCIRFPQKANAFTKQLFNIEFIMYSIALGSKLRNEKYDLVVTYDPLKTGIIGSALARIMKARFAPQINGVYTSSAVYLDNSSTIQSALKKRIYYWIEALVLRLSDGIQILFSEQLTPFAEVVKGKMIRCIPAYTDIEKFTATTVQEKKEVLFIGFPFRLKGVDILITAFKKICHKYPDWTLKIMGWFPKKDELERHIDNCKQIYYHPPVMFSKIPEHIGACSILVLPSRSEAMGRVLVEAMAAGKPRIGTNIDGIPTVINNGVDGFLFENENSDDLAERLEALMSNPELRRNMGDAGKMRAQKEFSVEVYTQRLKEFYESVICS